MEKQNTGASLIVQTLINHDVKQVLTIPGAKIDKILDEFNNYEDAPQLIVTHHEQNAAFIAQGIGKLSGKPGVVLVTSGPGVGNLATGLATATSESDPVLAIGGNVKRRDSLKRTHQSMQNVNLLTPVTKHAREVTGVESVSEEISNAYRIAMSGQRGATFVSIPQDVAEQETDREALNVPTFERMGSANPNQIKNLVEDIKNAKQPVMLLGMRASGRRGAAAIRKLLKKLRLPVVETFQGAGIISRDLLELFYGRVGLFENQPGDVILNESDLVISIGYDPIEYDPELWNSGDVNKKIYHIDSSLNDVDNFYRPTAQLWGDQEWTINAITDLIGDEVIDKFSANKKHLDDIKLKFDTKNTEFEFKPGLVHPIYLINTLQEILEKEEVPGLNDSTVVTVDVGSIYIWMARYFKSFEPRKLLFSNGMQTLGVALPWAIAANIVEPHKKAISMSGDGGFLFSAQELGTAVKLNQNITHIIWNDHSYNMVAFQQEMKYNRATAVDTGTIDFVKYAESFGAKGFRVNSHEDFKDTLLEALKYDGVAIIDVPIDYAQNIELGKKLVEGSI